MTAYAKVSYGQFSSSKEFKVARIFSVLVCASQRQNEERRCKAHIKSCFASSGKPQAQSPATNHAVRLSLFWCFCTVAIWVGMVRNQKRKAVLRNPSSNGASLNGKPIAQGRLGYLISLLSQNHRVQFKPGRPFSKAPCWTFDFASNVCDSHTKPCNNIAVQIQRCQKWNGFGVVCPNSVAFLPQNFASGSVFFQQPHMEDWMIIASDKVLLPVWFPSGLLQTCHQWRFRSPSGQLWWRLVLTFR